MGLNIGQIELGAESVRLGVEAFASMVKGEIGILFLALLALEILALIAKELHDYFSERRVESIEERIECPHHDCQPLDPDEAVRTL
jgi:hypothetical protein